MTVTVLPLLLGTYTRGGTDCTAAASMLAPAAAYRLTRGGGGVVGVVGASAMVSLGGGAAGEGVDDATGAAVGVAAPQAMARLDTSASPPSAPARRGPVARSGVFTRPTITDVRYPAVERTGSGW